MGKYSEARELIGQPLHPNTASSAAVAAAMARYHPYSSPSSSRSAAPFSGSGEPSDPLLLDGLVASPSVSRSHPSPSPKGKGKQRATRKKIGDDGAPAQPEEKRLARFKASCPKNILDRVDRVRAQRFFMVDRHRNGEELREQFQVLGSTGNVYTVTIDRLPACTCPDAQKGNHCKHILFIFLKVLNVPTSSPHFYQKALLFSELQSIFSTAPVAPNADPVAARLRNTWKEVTGRAGEVTEGEKAAAAGKKRLPSDDDDCPICYDSLPVGTEEGLVFCLAACGQALHDECHRQWANTCRSKGEILQCVYCRTPWQDDNVAKAGGSGGASVAGGATVSPDGFLNLADVAGIQQIRDTSTYYHGPRRGERYNPWHVSNRYQ